MINGVDQTSSGCSTAALLTSSAMGACIGVAIGALRSKLWVTVGAIIGGSLPIAYNVVRRTTPSVVHPNPPSNSLPVTSVVEEHETEPRLSEVASPPEAIDSPTDNKGVAPLLETPIALEKPWQGTIRLDSPHSWPLNADGAFEFCKTITNAKGQPFPPDRDAFYMMARLEEADPSFEAKLIESGRKSWDKFVYFPSFIVLSDSLKSGVVHYREEGQLVSLTCLGGRGGYSFAQFFEAQKGRALQRRASWGRPTSGRVLRTWGFHRCPYLSRKDVPDCRNRRFVCEVPVYPEHLYRYSLTPTHITNKELPKGDPIDAMQFQPISSVRCDLEMLEGLPNFDGAYEPGGVYWDTKTGLEEGLERIDMCYEERGTSLFVELNTFTFNADAKPEDFIVVIHAAQPSCLFVYVKNQWSDLDAKVASGEWTPINSDLDMEVASGKRDNHGLERNYLTPHLLGKTIDPKTVQAYKCPQGLFLKMQVIPESDDD